MKPTHRIMPLTQKKLRQQGTIAVALLAMCLIMILVFFQTEYVGAELLLIFGAICGLFGLLQAYGVFVQQAPQSRAFYKSSNVTQAVVLGSKIEKCKGYAGGVAGVGDGTLGCLAIVLELFMFSTQSPTYDYYLDIQFEVEESEHPQKLRVKVDNNLYSRVRQGSKIEVQYATADPRVLLIGLEIPKNK